MTLIVKIVTSRDKIVTSRDEIVTSRDTETWFNPGHESIRILNELISDIDELLNIDKYSRHIEKIKTALG